MQTFTEHEPLMTCGNAPWNRDRLSRDFIQAKYEKNQIQTNPQPNRLRSKKSQSDPKKTLQTRKKEIY